MNTCSIVYIKYVRVVVFLMNPTSLLKKKLKIGYVHKDLDVF